MNPTRSLFRLSGPVLGKSVHVVIPGTSLTVIVQTPTGGVINDVEVEVWNLRLQKTGADKNKITFTISDDEYDQRVATIGNKVNIKVRKSHFGPPSQTGFSVTPGEAVATFDFPKGTPSSFIMKLQDAGLNRYFNLLSLTPAREMTLREARDSLLSLHLVGRIRLIPEPTFNHTSAQVCDASCKLAHPLVGEPVGIDSKVHNVDYLHIANAIMPSAKADVTTSARSMLSLDSRHAVGLWRLARLLRSNYAATGILHIGISGGDGRVDCHGQGRAIDFGGVIGSDPTSGDYKLLVYHDWGLMQVWDLSDPQTDLSLKKRLPKLQNWPGGDRTLMYRLNPLPPGGDDLARRCFQDVYNFFVAEYNDKTATATQTDPPSVIGGGGRVMNPDHRDSNPGGKSGREAHINHMHAQIGSTGTDPVPAVEAEP